MAVCRILQLGDPLLRQVCAEVGDWHEALPVLHNLRDTLHEFQRRHGFGRGIAAVQIGAPVRVVYLEIQGRAHCLINPNMQWSGEEKFRLWDDCFSFPGLLVRVERARSVKVDHLDEHGQRQTIEASDAFAELLQHELDHLDGILAIDRAIGEHPLRTRAEHERCSP